MSDTLQLIYYDALESKLTSSYFDFASFAILGYDYLLTLNLEIQLVWPLPWNLGKVLYFINTYLVFINMIVMTMYQTAALSTSWCELLSKTSWSLLVVETCISETAIMFRTWILWQRSRTILMLFGFLTIFFGTCSIIFAALNLKGIIALPRGPDTPVSRLKSSGCIIGNTKMHLIAYISYINLVVIETILLALTYYKARQLLRKKPSNLMVAVYTDGVLYYVYLLGFSITNAILLGQSAGSGRIMTVLMEGIFHTVLTKRILLNLRLAIAEDRGDPNFLTRTAMASKYNGSTMEDTSVGVWSSVILGVDSEWWCAERNEDEDEMTLEDESEDEYVGEHKAHNDLPQEN